VFHVSVNNAVAIFRVNVSERAKVPIHTGCFKSRFTEKSNIKTTYLLSILLQKLFKMFAILFDAPSATFRYAINNGGA
jgi:hypothetical protein